MALTHPDMLDDFVSFTELDLDLLIVWTLSADIQARITS